MVHLRPGDHLVATNGGYLISDAEMLRIFDALARLKQLTESTNSTPQ